MFLAGIADESCLRNVSIGNVAVVMSFVSVGVVAAALQLTSLISAGVTSLFGSMGDYWATVGTLIFGIVSNFILTPYAMMTMLPTVVISYCIDIGWSWLPHFLSCYMAADLIFFPYEYPTVLIIFGFGMITMKNAIKMLSIKLVLSVIFIIAILMPYWKLLGLYAL